MDLFKKFHLDLGPEGASEKSRQQVKVFLDGEGIFQGSGF